MIRASDSRLPTTGPGDGNDAGLVVLGVRQPFTEYLGELWHRRHFAFALADGELRAKHMNSLLGQLWHLVNPALMILVYFLIFGVVLDARRGVDNYITFLVIGVVFFRFAQITIIGCSSCIQQNLGLIRSIQFPRALVPVSVVLQNLMALVPALALALVVAIVEGADISLRLLALPVVVGVAASFALGLGLVAARAGAVLTDLGQVLPHFFRIMFYVSGVLFNVRALIDDPTIRVLFSLNPFYGLVATARWSLMGEPVDMITLGGLLGWTVVGLVAGSIVFRRAEHRFGA